jgi:hypothetical protein
MWKKLIALAFLLSLANESWGVGEVLKLNTSGIQYCSGFRPQRFNPRNDRDLWLSIDSTTAATIYEDVGLTMLVAVLDVDSAMISPNKASFSAFYVDSVDQDHIAAIGAFTLDRQGSIKSLKATLVRRGVFNDGCYSKGVVTGKRIN